MSFLTDIFGGSDSKSQSGNNAYPFIQSNFGASGAGAFNSGLGALSGLLMGNDSSGLNNFFNSAGGQFLMKQGTNAVTSSKAAQGLLKSGSYGTALEQYGQGLADTYEQNYINDLLGFSKLGLGAGDLLANAGQFSKGNGSSSSGGLGSFLGAALAFI